MNRARPMGREWSFQARLENWAEGMDYGAVAVPAAITQALGTKRAVPVIARVDDSQPFRVSLFPVGGGKHWIRIKATVRQEAGVRVGDRIRVRFEVIDPAEVAVPQDLAGALRAAGARDAFDALTPGKRSFIIRRIDEAVRAQTRERRIEQAVANLGQGGAP